PMSGTEVRMNTLIMGDDVGAASLITCEVMGIRPNSVRHFKLAFKEGMMPKSATELTLNTELPAFKEKKFYMKRALLDWISMIGFNSKFITKLFWDSKAAGPLHWVLYTVRRIPVVERMLYGKAGSPPEWDHSK
ncbi:hypothetical protein ACFLYP_04365, partial [Chloroflexota bacterium]